MRTILIISFILINIAAYTQISVHGEPSVKGQVESIIEKSNGYNADWREYSFDSLSRIIEIKYYRDSKLLENKLYSYKTINDSIMESTETIKSSRGNNMYHSRYYYDSQKRILRYELYKMDSNIPFIIELNTKYEQDKIKQYDRIIIPNDTSVIINYKVDYLKNKIIIRERDNKNLSWPTTVLKYNNKRNLVKRTVDYHDPEYVLAGVRWYSHSSKDKYEIKYKYDKVGNWIQSYSVTRFWKYKKDSREIKYK